MAHPTSLSLSLSLSHSNPLVPCKDLAPPDLLEAWKDTSLIEKMKQVKEEAAKKAGNDEEKEKNITKEEEDLKDKEKQKTVEIKAEEVDDKKVGDEIQKTAATTTIHKDETPHLEL